VGEWYQEFGQTTDEEVRQLLHAAARKERVTRGMLF
jgi:predicted phosphoribosyltransferase